jgi:hypothetical protein
MFICSFVFQINMLLLGLKGKLVWGLIGSLYRAIESLWEAYRVPIRLRVARGVCRGYREV